MFNLIAERGKIFGGGFGRVGEQTVGFGIHRNNGAAQFFQKHSGRGAAGTVDTIENNLKSFCGDEVFVNQGENFIHMDARRLSVDRNLPAL